MECKNCNKPLTNTQKYCDECGARVIQNRLTPKVLMNQINEEFISIDNKFLRTFIHLFTKPEDVINRYIYGTRKKYINVLQYFALALTFLGIQVFFMENIFNAPELYKIGFLEEFAKTSNQKDNPFLNGKFDDFNAAQSVFFTLSIPISAFATWLSYRITNVSTYNFTEHTVINLYYGSQITIFSAFIYTIGLGFGINYFVSAIPIFVVTYIYFFYILKRIFKTNFWVTLGNFILTLFIFFILFSIISFMITIAIAVSKLSY